MLMQLTRMFVGEAAKDFREEAEAEELGVGYAGGFAADARIATPFGYREAGTLKEGDLVMTVDDGWQPVKEVRHSKLWPTACDCPVPLWPLSVPARAFGGARSSLLMPGQYVLIEEETAMSLFGSFSVVIPAAQLDGFFGIARVVPRQCIGVVEIALEHDQVLLAEGGATILCPQQGGECGIVTLDDLLNADGNAHQGNPQAAYPILTEQQARRLLYAMTRAGQQSFNCPAVTDDEPQAAFA
ncbi:Hint domain-containing protein [Brevirhabdus sp.]|uniref:Hint domain-containing protein n=1 Tax=Brevirhabdus sp. TaxID=2004514 RepID=UPI004058E30D